MASYNAYKDFSDSATAVYGFTYVSDFFSSVVTVMLCFIQ